jgi:site-specific recombinase XerD
LGHNRRTVGIPTGYAIPENYWDETGRKIKKNCPGIENATRVNNLLDKERARALDVLTRLHDRDELKTLSLSELKAKIERQEADMTFFVFTEELVQSLVEQKRIGTANYYRNVLREVSNFRKQKDFQFRELTHNFLLQFERAYLSRGLERNGLNVHLRGIKAICNRAIKAGHMEKEQYPFAQYAIKAKPTKKRAIAIDAIQRIIARDLSTDSKLFEARSLFLLSFGAWGAPFIDLAFLKVSNIVNGRLQYKRRKTGKHYDIKITPDVKNVIDHFAAGKSSDDYLLPVIKRTELQDQYSDIDEARRRYNKRLKKLATLAGIDENLTSYVSRHSRRRRMP